MNKIKISTPRISLINNIGNPSNYPKKYTLEMAESGVNIHISNEATPRMALVIISKNMTARIPHGSKME